MRLRIPDKHSARPIDFSDIDPDNLNERPSWRQPILSIERSSEHKTPMTLKNCIPLPLFRCQSMRLWLARCLQASALLLALATPSLHAATALLLSTDESGNSDTNSYVTAALHGLSTALGASQVTDMRGALSDMPTLDLSDADFSGQNIVMLVTGYEPIDAARWAVVKNQLFTNPETIFLFFVDGCCSNATNIDEVTQALDEATGLGLNTEHYSNVQYDGSRLNINSYYSSDFESQPIIWGVDAALITNVPAELALYLPPDADTLTPNAGERVDTLGFLVPKELNHAGLGACAFVLADSNALGSNAELMVGNFVRAALNPAGACQLDFPNMDLSVTLPPQLSAPAPGPLTLPITVENLGQANGGESALRITLPSGVRATQSDMPSSCYVLSEPPSNQAQQLLCYIPALASQASQPIALPVMVELAGSFPLQLEVITQEADSNLSNNRASSQIVIGGATAPRPVPVNGLWWLLALSGLMAMGWTRRNR